MKTLIVILALAIAVVLFWACPAQALDVVDAQRELNALGYNVGTADGKMGPRTIQGIKKFQKSRDILETGKLNKVTRDALAPSVLDEGLQSGLSWTKERATNHRPLVTKYWSDAKEKRAARRKEFEKEKKSKNEGPPLWGFFWLLVILAIYLNPTIVAVTKRHLRWEAIFWLNLLLGWLLIPWVIALCWALCPPIKPAEAAS